MKPLIEKVKSSVRGSMYEVAKLLDTLTDGFVRPWHITLLSFLGHVVILFALAEGLFVNAAILLVGFGLMDALDGALARYQKRESLSGMLLDSTTDRLKETLIYAGLVYYFTTNNEPLSALYAVLALGFSFAVSYVKAKGEVALLESARGKQQTGSINREFEAGIFGYEIRMLILVVGLLAGDSLLLTSIAAIAAGSLFSFFARFKEIVHRLEK